MSSRLTCEEPLDKQDSCSATSALMTGQPQGDDVPAAPAGQVDAAVAPVAVTAGVVIGPTARKLR